MVRFGTVYVHVSNSVVTLGGGGLPPSVKRGSRAERGATGGGGTPLERVTETVIVSVLVRVASSNTVMVEVPLVNASGTGKAVPVVISTVTVSVTVDNEGEVTALAGRLIRVSAFSSWRTNTPLGEEDIRTG